MRSRISAVGFMLMWLTLLMISTVVHAIDVSGSITANTTWRAADSPFVVTGVVDVRNDAVLTIEPGVVVRFASAGGLSIVRGTLIARGVVGVPITFTSVRDVSGNTAQPGDWGNIEFGPEASGQSVIERARVAYGRGIKIRQWSGRLENLSIENHLGAAIDADLISAPAGGNLSATGNLINGITIPSGIIRNNARLALTGIPYVVQKGWLRVGGEAVFLQPNPLDIEPTTTGEMTLSIAEPAPVGGRTATLTSNAASLLSFPPTVLIPAGETEQRFAVTAGANPGNATINAVVPGVGDGSAMVQVRAQPRLVWSGPGSVIVGEERTLTLSLDPPSATPRTVSITNSDPTRLTAPTSITVTNSQPVTVRGLAIGAVNLDATTPDYLSASKSLDVRLRAMNWPGGVVVPPGATVSVRVALDTVPVEGRTFMVSSSNPAVATVPTMVTAPASATHVNVPVTGVSEGTTQLSISAEGYTSATTQATVQIITISFDEAQAKVARGLSEPYRVRLNRAAPQGGLTIDVGSSNTDLVTVSPTSVFIPAGATQSPTVVDVTGVVEGQATLTASANGLESGVLPVDVLPPLTLQWSRQGVQRVGVGMYSDFTAILQLRAGTQDYSTRRLRPLSLMSSMPEALSAGAPTLWAPGNGRFRLTGLQESAEAVELTAQLAGVTSPPMLVQVIKPQLQFQSINFNQTLGPPSRNLVESVLVVPGASDVNQLTVAARSIALTLEARDPANIVEGFFNSPTAGTTIASVLIAADQRQSAAFWVGAPVAAGTYRIGAQSAGLDNAVSPVITVTDFELRFNVVNSIVGKGLRSTALQVQRYRNGSLFTGGAASVNLISSDSSRLLVSTNVGFANGQSSATVQITGVERSTGVQVTARANGYRDGTVVVQVVDPVVVFNDLDGQRTVGAGRDEFRIGLQVPGYSGPGQVAANEVPLVLDLVEVSPAGIVTTIHPTAAGTDTIATVNIASGSSQSASRYIGTPSGVGSYKVRATQVGNTNSPWLSAAQSVVSNAVVFSAESYRLSAGFERQLLVRLQNSIGIPGVSVALSCEPVARCRVSPAEVTLSSGTAVVTLTGVSSGEAILIAQPNNALINAGQSVVEVTPLEINFVYPENSENSGYRGFWLEEINGARPVDDLLINLELFDVDPAVDIEFLAQGLCTPNCTPVGSTTITPFLTGRPTSGQTGFGQSDDVVGISDPGQGASWKVRASIVERGEWISPPQLVIAGPHPIYVAQGLRTPISVSVFPPELSGTTFDASCGSPACGVEGNSVIPANGSAELRIVPFNPGFTDYVWVSAERLAPSSVTVDIGQPSFHASEPETPLQVGNSIEVMVKLWREDRLQCAANSNINVAISSSDEKVVVVPASIVFAAGSCWQTFTLNPISAGVFQLEFSSNGFETLTWPEIEVLP